MALRVLLADESVTIKKVIQLALQDFAVEVKAVPVGLDVLEVSKSFQPDLIFADILLQKRSGYEVCRDLKKDQATAAIPVVLMWSSFMELDQKQLESCAADGRLEKPFEVEALRKLVLELVPRTRSQRIATFLEYPSTIALPLKSEVESHRKTEPTSTLPANTPPANTESTPPVPSTDLGALPDLNLEGQPSQWNMESFEPPDISIFSDTNEDSSSKIVSEEFTPIRLPETPLPKPEATQAFTPFDFEASDSGEESEPWTSRPLEKYQIEPLSAEESLAVDDLSLRLTMQPKRRSAEIPKPEKEHGDHEKSRFHQEANMNNHRKDPEPVFSLDEFDDDSDENEAIERLELHQVDEAKIIPKPAHIREILKEPEFIKRSEDSFDFSEPEQTHTNPKRQSNDTDDEFSFDDDRTAPMAEQPPAQPTALSSPKVATLEERMAQDIAPQLERAIEKIVSDLLPKIAEKIIKKELDRLIDDD